MAVTLKDVAARAGVTPTVVSRVLHNRATAIRVSDATAARVKQAAVDLGYRVNVMARNFRERQTMMIGVLHGIGFGRPRLDDGSRYFACLMDGIVDGAFQHGYSVTLCPKLLGATPEDAMADGRFDGLIWYSTFPSGENYRMLETCRVPLVLIHTPAELLNGRFPSVLCDNNQGIGLAVDHLVELGHEKIAFGIEGDLLFYEAESRRDAYFEHMSRHGLTAGPEDVIDIRTDRTGLHEYFAKAPRHTAVIGCNDAIAAAFIEEGPEFGFEVPLDLSVIGFDSTAYCNELRPSLTAVSQPLADLGRAAVDLLVATISSNPAQPLQVMFPCGLDVRGSTAPPKKVISYA